jgi:integral membrane protein
MELLKTNIGRLRIVGFLEGMSFLFLIGVAMPLKYVWGYTHATQEIGMAHGVLFVLYLFVSIPVILEFKWSFKVSTLVLAASFFPLGTFIAEYKLFRVQTSS